MPAQENKYFSKHTAEMCVYVCVSVCVCAHAPRWQPLDRSKAAMMNRHLAQGNTLAQWAVNLPLPVSACRMLNKVIWIFVILMYQHVKSPMEPSAEEKYEKFNFSVLTYATAVKGISENLRQFFLLFSFCNFRDGWMR